MARIRFQLEYPGRTDLVCSVCEVLGGREVDDEEEAERLSIALERKVEAGEFLKEQACVPDHFPAELRGLDGLPCPRTSLDPDNVGAIRLFSMLVSEEGRPLAGPALARMGESLSAEQFEDLTRRVMSAVTDPEINRIRRRLIDEEIKRQREESVDG